MNNTSISLGEIAKLLGAELVGESTKVISGLSTLAVAESCHLSFFSNSKYLKALQSTSAGVVILEKKNLSHCPASALVMEDPYWGYARASQMFARSSCQAGVHQLAVIDSTASIPSSTSIGAGTVIEAGVVLGERVVIGPGCVLGENAQLGDDCRLHANVTLYHGVRLGYSSVVHSGSVIGADGFGYAPHEGAWEKIEQLGAVVIGNGVEIGANTTVDRGALEDTSIGDGAIIDNQIQIGHNVVIGEGTAIAACTAIAGSTKIGRYCTIAGAVAIAGHIEIADRVHINGMSLVSKSITEAGVYASGTGGVMKYQIWQKNAARFRKLNELVSRVVALEKKLN
ncbi:MAG: UDP-3-O-(3-hydroxymyristoyl)glucosamine N-acyltransferase [Gammaproteobacteria bacterium]|nr:UDP-3-O-(3-hydroxymyristoyl)glucosamine N-acyltransferase [Gammaproteobacteria bacterium]